MYDNNPTLENIAKTVDPNKQGSVLETYSNDDSNKKFYIESYGCAMNFSDS